MKTILITLLSALALALFLLAPWAANHAKPAPSSPYLEGTIRHNAICESSGVAASRRHPGVFWTHNDQGNEPVIYAISRDGRLLGEFRVDSTNDDWEDIAVDDAGNLYIGNTGNNDSRRNSLQVLMVEEPDPVNATARDRLLPVKRSWTLQFPERPFDCESLFVHAGRGYVISKVFKRSRAELYSFPLDADGGKHVLQRIAELPIQWPVTSADLSPDARRLAVVSTKGMYIYDVSVSLDNAGKLELQHFPLDPRQNIEGCCFTDGGVLATSESRSIFFFPAAKTPSSPQANRE